MMSELLRHSSKPEVRAAQGAPAAVSPAAAGAARRRPQAASRWRLDQESARKPATPAPLQDLFGEEDGWLMPALSAVPLPGVPSADADDELLAAPMPPRADAQPG